MQSEPHDLERFNQYLSVRLALKARIDKSRGDLASLLPALLYWCSQRSGPDPVTGQPYFEMKVQPDMRDAESRDVRAVTIHTWNGKELALNVNEQGGGVLVGGEFYDSIAVGDPSDVAGITFLAPRTGGRQRPDRSLSSFLKPLDDHAFQSL